MQGSGAEPSSGPAAIPDVELARIAPDAVQIVLALAGEVPLVAEAVYLRRSRRAARTRGRSRRIPGPRLGTLRRPRGAGTRRRGSGWAGTENFSDFAHAKDCFEKGAKAGVESCAYVRSCSIHSFISFVLSFRFVSFRVSFRVASPHQPCRVPSFFFVFALFLALPSFHALPSFFHLHAYHYE